MHLPVTRLAPAWAIVLASTLLVLTLLWQVPMMLWDHLDLVPIYLAWQDGRLAGSDFWSIHGGHMHSAAYAALLWTTYLSNGQTWLDGLVSWGLLVVYAVIVLRLLQRATTEERSSPGLALIALAFLFYPGHLANLQWGWQVAVFLCLAGVAACIALLTVPGLCWRHNLAALAAAGTAYMSFGHGIALLPAALAVLALHPDLTRRQRLAFSVPWLLAGAVLVLLTAHIDAVSNGPALRPIEIGLYVLNYLGAGVARYATTLAPWLAAISLITLVMLLPGCGDRRAILPWLALVMFSLFAAMLVACARAPTYGSEHGFVTRYVSFSSLYWLAWLVLTRLLTAHSKRGRRWLKPLAVVIVVSAAVNALHLIKKTHRLSVDTQAIAVTIAQDHPNVADEVLAEIYFDQPVVARERLDQLRRLGFAPFARRDSVAPAGFPPQE